MHQNVWLIQLKMKLFLQRNKMFEQHRNPSITSLLPKTKGKYQANEPLSKHTWLAVGGPAEVLYHPKDADDLKHFLQNKPHNIPVYLIGGGSNLLIRDGGILGVVIKLDNKNFQQIEIGPDYIKCGAGLPNAMLTKTLLKHELGGLEFLCSIPGVIGGSIKTNAGCFGSEIKDVLISAEVMNGLGQINTLPAQDFNLSYRNSLFPDDWIILSVTLKTYSDKKENIKNILEQHKNYRKQHQPHNVKTAGSTFKNPQGLKAWELIKNSGCASLSVGGAKVSEIHNNFLINTGTATAADIEELGEQIIACVKEKTSITLEWEIKKLGVKK